jgi:amino acid transporter
VGESTRAEPSAGSFITYVDTALGARAGVATALLVTVVLTAAAIWLTARGVKLSTVAVGAAVLIQVAIMLAVCFLVLVDQRAVLSGIPFSWAHLTGGLAGLSAGFPLALFMFIGWENGPALAEEWRSRPPCSSSPPT